MESIVKFRDRQELQSSDLNNSQAFAQAALDHVVVDAIDPAYGYRGFTATKTSATEVTVSAGRLYNHGVVYARNEPVVVDMFNLLPLVTKKRVAITAWGQTVDTDVQPRDFLIDAETGLTEPQSVAMESNRYCNISPVQGSESPDPAYPSVDANITVVAYALLDTNGVVSVEQWQPTQLRNLRTVGNDLDAVELWRDQIGARIDTLATDLYALSNRVSALASKEDLFALQSALLEVINRLNQPQAEPPAVLSHAVNNFASDTDADTEFSGYSCLIDRGLKFFHEAEAKFAMSLLNPLDPNIVSYGDISLPVHTHRLRWGCRGYHDEHRCGTATFFARTWIQQNWSRYSINLSPQESNKLYQIYYSGEWHSGVWASDPAWEQFWYYFDYQITGDYEDGSPWTMGGPFENAFASLSERQKLLFLDLLVQKGIIEYKYQGPYWDIVTKELSVTSYEHAQTFNVSQDGWLTKVGLYFTRVSGSGDVEIMICKTDLKGLPDYSRVLSRTTIDHEDLESGGDEATQGLPPIVETVCPIVPTALQAGEKYAIVVGVKGDHWLAISEDIVDASVVQGTFYYGDNGVWRTRTNGGILKHNLYFAYFTASRYVVDLQPWQLAGGIRELKLVGQIINLGSSKIIFEGQIGGVWKPITFNDTLSLSSLPAVLPMRMVFEGTPDVHGGIMLPITEVTVRRSLDEAVYVSALRTLGADAATVTVKARMLNYVEVDHNCTCVLKTNTDATTETADVVADVPIAADVIERTWTFNITPEADYRYIITMQTNSINNMFVIGAVADTSKE